MALHHSSSLIGCRWRARRAGAKPSAPAGHMHDAPSHNLHTNPRRLQAPLAKAHKRVVPAAAAPAAAVPRGALIVFEGADRCGKTTQCAELVEALTLRGVPVQNQVCPDRVHTRTGPCINAYLKGDIELDDAAVHLLFSVNRWERRDAVVAALLSGTTVVFDRYSYSGAAYTAAKQQPHLPMAWCRAPEAGLPAPDVVLYLRLPPGAAAARAGFGGERYEEEGFQARVVQAFDAFGQEECWVPVDASGFIDDVHMKVLGIVEPVLLQCQQGATIGSLWSDVHIVH